MSQAVSSPRQVLDPFKLCLPKCENRQKFEDILDRILAITDKELVEIYGSSHPPALKICPKTFRARVEHFISNDPVNSDKHVRKWIAGFVERNKRWSSDLGDKIQKISGLRFFKGYPVNFSTTSVQEECKSTDEPEFSFKEMRFDEESVKIADRRLRYSKIPLVEVLPYILNISNPLLKSSISATIRHRLLHGAKDENVNLFKELDRIAQAEKNPISLYMIALFHELGVHVDEKLDLAFSFYQRASHLGLTIATWKLGRCHQKGLGTPQDILMAIECFRSAGNSGFSEAWVSLGHLYELGKPGFPPKKQEALRCYQEADKLGNKQGTFEMKRLINSQSDQPSQNQSTAETSSRDDFEEEGAK